MGFCMFAPGKIHDVLIRDLTKFIDDRGWLTELYRTDEVPGPHNPVMGYISITFPGVARGPHEHRDQADFFAFLGPSNFKVYLWDSRKGSPSYGTRQIVYAGEDAPKTVIIPAGVVHAYRNIGRRDGMVVNLPNRLYAGKEKKEAVDEIRHENDPSSPYQLD